MVECLSKGVQVAQSVVRLIRDDITDLEVDAFVFYAQSDLVLGSGFGNAIAVRGGPSIQKELEESAPVAPGEAVVSKAGNLKAGHIIHAVGPKFQEEDTEPKLRTTVANSLKRADENGFGKVALPAMGAGYYGIAPDVCARVMVDVVANHLKGKTTIQEVVICVLDTPQYEAFQARLTASN